MQCTNWTITSQDHEMDQDFGLGTSTLKSEVQTWRGTKFPVYPPLLWGFGLKCLVLKFWGWRGGRLGLLFPVGQILDQDQDVHHRMCCHQPGKPFHTCTLPTDCSMLWCCVKVRCAVSAMIGHLFPVLAFYRHCPLLRYRRHIYCN